MNFFPSFLLLVAFACSVPLLTVAQPEVCTATIEGRVLDEHDRSPLAFAEVRLVEGQRSAMADEQGYFKLDGICQGVWTFRVVHIGCEPSTRVVTVRGNMRFDVYLEHHHEELRALEVARERPDENVGQAQQHADRAAMERSSGGGFTDVLSGIQGLAVLSTGPTIGKPVVHGLSGNRVLLLNQGVRQEDQQWGAEHAPSIDPLSADRITVVKGAAGVQYGSDAIGGVIIAEAVELPNRAGLSGEVRTLGSSNSRGGGGSALVQGGFNGLNGWGWRLQGSGRYMGDGRAAEYVLSNTGLREVGGSGAFGYRGHHWQAQVYYSWFARELGILRASHIGNLTDLRNAIASGEPWFVAPSTYAIDAPRQTVQHHLLKAEASRAVNEHDRVVFTYAYQADSRQEYDIRRGGRSATPALDMWLATHSADIVYKHWLGKHVHGKVGVNALFQSNSNIPGTGVRPLIPDYDKQSAALFMVEHFPLNDRTELEAGARIDRTTLQVARYDAEGLRYIVDHRFDNHAISIGANWMVCDSTRLRLNVSSAFRPPHVSELYSEGLHHGAAAIETGDASLVSEHAWKAVVDMDSRNLRGRLHSVVTLHASSVDNYIYLLPSGYRLTVRGAFPVFNYVATDVLLIGADADVRYDLHKNWQLGLGGSTVRGRDTSNDRWLFQLPSDRMEGRLVWSRNKEGAWPQAEVEVITTMVFQQHRVPMGVDYTDPPSTYRLLGFAARLTRALPKGQLRFGMRATNLLNVAYRDYMDRFRYYTDARGVDVTLWCTYVFGNASER